MRNATISDVGQSQTEALMRRGVQLHLENRFADAERIYHEVLRKQPMHSGALHLLGLVAFQSGQVERGVEFFDRAITIRGDFSEAYDNRGTALYALNRFEEAVASYDKAIKLKPGNAAVHSNRGNVLQALGRHSDALASYDRAIALAPSFAEAHFGRGATLNELKRYEDALASHERAIALNSGYAKAFQGHGIALYGLKRLEDSLASYDRAIALNPVFAEAFVDRGVALEASGCHEDAVASHDRAIALKPDFAGAFNNRGIPLLALRLPEAALASFDKAIDLRPDYAEAHTNRGNALHALDRHDDALASHDRAISLRADYGEAYSNRGNALSQLGRYEDAVASYQKSIALNPDFAEAFNNRGIPLLKLGFIEEALASFDKAIDLRPDYAEAYTNRGNALCALNRHDDALASHDRAISLRADYGDAYSNRADALSQLGRYEDAVASCQKSIALNPDFVQAHINLSMCLLRLGRFEVGWREYEWRAQADKSLSTRQYSQPIWVGQAFGEGKTIFLYHEQGFGDTIQFCRYAAIFATRGADVVVSAPTSLHGLIATLDPKITVIGESDVPDHFDFHCPMLSLPLAFGTTLDTIPGTAPYLKADVAAVDRWRNRLGPTQRPRVGIVWNGGHRPNQPATWAVNRRRNIDFEVFAALNMPEIEFVSLQKGEPAEFELRQKRAEFWPASNLLDVAEDLRDFNDTAALIEALDLVIAVDTSVAHLAGALGKPVWILNRFDGCWRWLSDRTDSPWYPTARLFRQPAPGDWASVIAEVRQALCTPGVVTYSSVQSHGRR